MAKKTGFFFLLAFALLANTMAQWVNTSWTYKIPCIVNSTVGVTLNNYPAMCQLNTSALFNVASPKMLSNCADLRVSNASETIFLTGYEIVGCGWNATNTAIFFSVSALPSGNNTFYLYYGNNAATDAQNASGVWQTAGANLVMHFENKSNLFYDSAYNVTFNVSGGSITTLNVVSCGAPVGICLNRTNPGGNVSYLFSNTSATTRFNPNNGGNFTFSYWKRIYEANGANTKYMGTLAPTTASLLWGVEYNGNEVHEMIYSQFGATDRVVANMGVNSLNHYSFMRNGSSTYAALNTTFWQQGAALSLPTSGAAQLCIIARGYGGCKTPNNADANNGSVTLGELRFWNSSVGENWLTAEQNQQYWLGSETLYGSVQAPVIWTPANTTYTMQQNLTFSVIGKATSYPCSYTLVVENNANFTINYPNQTISNNTNTTIALPRLWNAQHAINVTCYNSTQANSSATTFFAYSGFGASTNCTMRGSYAPSATAFNITNSTGACDVNVQVSAVAVTNFSNIVTANTTTWNLTNSSASGFCGNSLQVNAIPIGHYGGVVTSASTDYNITNTTFAYCDVNEEIITPFTNYSHSFAPSLNSQSAYSQSTFCGAYSEVAAVSYSNFSNEFSPSANPQSAVNTSTFCGSYVWVNPITAVWLNYTHAPSASVNQTIDTSTSPYCWANFITEAIVPIWNNVTHTPNASVQTDYNDTGYCPINFTTLAESPSAAGGCRRIIIPLD